MSEYDAVKSGILEMLGCFALMFFGSFTSKLPDGLEDRKKLLFENAIANLFIYMVMMWLAAKFSGAQFNPLLTVAMLVVGDLPFSIAMANIFAQAAGAFLGFFILKTAIDYNEPYFNYNNVNALSAVFFEFLVSFVTTLVFLMTFCHKQADRGVYALAVPAIYAIFTISIGSLFYSRYNLLMLLANSVLSFEFYSNFLFVVIGGVAGPTAATLLYLLAFKDESRKDSIVPMMDDDNEIKF